MRGRPYRPPTYPPRPAKGRETPQPSARPTETKEAQGWKGMRVMLAILALALLTSCASLRKDRVTFVAPRIDCAVSDVPRARKPSPPTLTDGVPAWQLYAHGWQAYAIDVLSQRVETADCIEQMRQKGLVK